MLHLILQLTLVANAAVYDTDGDNAKTIVSMLITGAMMSVVVVPIPLVLSFICKRVRGGGGYQLCWGLGGGVAIAWECNEQVYARRD